MHDDFIIMFDSIAVFRLVCNGMRYWVPRMIKLLLIGLLALSGCTYVERPSEPSRHLSKKAEESPKHHHKRAGKAPRLDKASWYASGFHNKRTATGEIFDQNELTAGSRSLPLGTVVEVTNLKNGKRVKVKVNDRGPWAKGRTLYLSRAAAERLDMVKTGLTPVKITMITKQAFRHKYRPKNRQLRLACYVDGNNAYYMQKRHAYGTPFGNQSCNPSEGGN